MKKIVLGVCLFGVMALLATSCQKKEETAKLYSTNQELVSEDGDFEFADGAKVYFTGNKLYFDANDEVRLFSINETEPSQSRAARYTPTVGSQVDNNTVWTLLEGEIELPTSGDRYAYCPGDIQHVILDQTFNDPINGQNRATFVLPAELDYREVNGVATLPQEGFYMASKLQAGQNTFSFRNICGVLHLKLYSTHTQTRVVKKIVVTDNFKHLSGNVSMFIHKVNPETLSSLFNNYDENNPSYVAALNSYIAESGYSVSNMGMSVTLNCGDGIQLDKYQSTAKDFYIPLRPLALRKGCKIEVYVDGVETPITLNSNKNNMIKPNSMKNMSPVNIR